MSILTDVFVNTYPLIYRFYLANNCHLANNVSIIIGNLDKELSNVVAGFSLRRQHASL